MIYLTKPKINIYDYKEGQLVLIIDIDDKEWYGYILSLDDAEEYDEDDENSEDCITIFFEGRAVGLRVSEIKTIKVINE